MKIKIFALQYGNVYPQLLANNIANSGDVEYDLQTLRISPLSKALNTGLADFSNGYDLVGFLANDIEEPVDWLKKRVEYLKSNPGCGIVAIYPTAGEPPQCADIIGNFLITKNLFRHIGFFIQDFNNYGPIDLDYCTRARCAGFTTDYLPNERADHKYWNKEDEYGFNKSECVKDSWSSHVKNVTEYMDLKKDLRIIYPEYNINFKEWQV